MAGIEPDVRVFQDTETLSQAAAAVFVSSAREAISGRGEFQICFSGGKTPERLYQVLAHPPHRGMIDWTRVRAFWGDERCVPPEDINSNYRQARELLLSNVPIPAENIHRIRTELDPELAAVDYALILKMHATPPLEWPRFDLVLLGLGRDGHTASLFPETPVSTAGATMATQSRDPERPGWRITLTPAVFNSGRRIVFLVQGAGKSKVVAQVLYGESQPEHLPAQRIHPQDGELIWMLDSGAAAKA